MTTIVTENPYNTYMVVELTSIWTPPCSPIIPFEYYDTTSCAPPQYESVWYDGGYYSPAICPSGYTSGCEPTKTMKAGQTGAICVPSGWECSSFQMHAFTVDGGKTTSVPAFQIRWEEGDLSLLETNPLTPAAAETDNSKDTPSDEKPGSESESPTESGTGDKIRDKGRDGNEGGGGLPTGAVVGIAVGVTLLVAIVLFAGFLCYRKRHLKARRSEDAMGVEKLSTGPEKPFNPEGAPPVYPDVPQEMEGSTKVAPRQAPLNGPGMSPHSKQQVSQGRPHDEAVQQLDGSPVSPPELASVSQQHTPGSNVPISSEFHSSTATIPAKLESWRHPGSGTHPAEIDHIHQVPELPPQQGMGELHATPVASELEASIPRSTKRRSGRMGWVNVAPDFGEFFRNM